MIKSMKLRGKIQLENDRTLTFSSTLYDGTPFSLTVTDFDVQLNEPFTPNSRIVEGFLFVRQESQQDNRCYLTLPKPTIQHGKQVTVGDLQLMPRHVDLSSFNTEKKSPQKKTEA